MSFDYVKVNQADAPEPFTLQDLFGSMKDLDLDGDAPFVGVMYGDPGTRKTTRTVALAQKIIPAGKKILYIYTGQGWTSLKNHPELQFGKDGKKNIKAMPFIRYEQIETLRAVLMNEAMREKMNIGAVVFDEYNRMQDMDTDQLTKHRAKLVNEGPRQTNKEGQEIYKDPDTPEWPEYNTTKVRLINLLNDVFTIPETHFFFICHTRFQKKTGMIEPDFPEKTGAALISMVHSLYLCKKDTDLAGNTTFPIELVGTDRTVSKNRIGGLPAVIYDINDVAVAYAKWGVMPEGTKVPDVKEQLAEVKEMASPALDTPAVDAFIASVESPQEKAEAIAEKVQEKINEVKPEPEAEPAIFEPVVEAVTEEDIDPMALLFGTP